MRYMPSPAHKCTLTLNPTSLQNNTTNVVIQQHSRKFLMMDILMSETCWAHKKWNKIASNIKLVFYSSTITMMHGPINIRLIYTDVQCRVLRIIYIEHNEREVEFYGILWSSNLVMCGQENIFSFSRPFSIAQTSFKNRRLYKLLYVAV